MRQAVLTCDRCGKQEWIAANTGAEGWRLITADNGVVTTDLCPECAEAVTRPLDDADVPAFP